MKYLFLACGMAALFAACQNENEPKVVSDKPGTSGDYRIIIEGEETDAQTSRSSGTIQFVGGTASGAGLYDGVGRAFVSATPDPGYEIDYFYGGPDSEPKKYDYANGGATSFDVPINGQDHLFHVGFKEKTGTLTINAGTGGTVSPSGQVAIQREVPFSIKATPNSGYEFTGWTVNSGNVTIANASSTSTTATLNSSSGTITANFKEAITETKTIYARPILTQYGDSKYGITFEISDLISDHPIIQATIEYQYKTAFTLTPKTENIEMSIYPGSKKPDYDHTLSESSTITFYQRPHITKIDPNTFGHNGVLYNIEILNE